ncbi:MAG: cobyrinate a,c-diamide synthase [Nitrospina sp.]|jgi:cobyrinic acid a,c-diamide synthase|nr:cobyrinate a,c-diamide synthase [Nitrospina sp.]MBT3874523.1 cobyrinate a,c-diamide synthase [Nitrospina sp.]MBT4049874.1 cobyrinate a,c-diamide synthase [Nitrospina sp.]MBT4557860.1 cobyrinate a,c-diamide synthase [Nitrospina sp.]MBT5347992.1 cobyrinate a,c-diamide synthase [Nitrospina sp.]
MSRIKKYQGLVVAGTHSSAGKSSVSMGLMRLLSDKGWSIKPFKVGPDYIDPAHHTRACNQPSYNLDTVMCTKKYVKELFNDVVHESDLAIVEGVMGLHDGASPTSEKGSTAEIAKLLNLPVLLVIDGRAVSRSSAAMVLGFMKLDPKLNLIGVIANNINSPRHAKLIKSSIEHYTSAKLLACLPTSPELIIPSRHLGLQQGIEQKANIYRKWAKHIESHMDLKKFFKLFKLKKPQRSLPQPKQEPKRWREKKKTGLFSIAVARDEAFQFIYQDTLDFLAHHGFNVSFFSPLKDSSLPKSRDVYYFPGGYPELHAQKLSKNQPLLNEIKKAGSSGKLIIGECGGLMYLGKGIIDAKGKKHPLAGIFNYSTSLKTKKLTLGYRKLEERTKDQLKSKLILTGHEFHYSSLVNNKETPNWVQTTSNPGMQVSDGFRKSNCFSFYSHIYWGSNSSWIKYIINLTKQ